MKKADATEIVLDLASQQWGLFTSAQAGELGVSGVVLTRLASANIISRARHGVYLAEGTLWTPVTDIRAEWLALAPKVLASERVTDVDAIVSHESAAQIWGIGDLNTGGVHFTVPERRQTRQADVHFHQTSIGPEEWVLHEGLPVTSAFRTTCDLADKGHDSSHIRDLANDANAKNLLSATEINKLNSRLSLDLKRPPSSQDSMQILAETMNKQLAPIYDQLSKLSHTHQRALEAIVNSLEPKVSPEFSQIQARLAASILEPTIPQQWEVEHLKRIASNMQASRPEITPSPYKTHDDRRPPNKDKQ